jgi:hypothetical protein
VTTTTFSSEFFGRVLVRRLELPDRVLKHEFNRAYERHSADTNSISVLFYFKDAAIAPSEIDSDQLAAVKRFQDSLGPKGVLWFPFSEARDFDRLLRLHLTRELQVWKERSRPGPDSEPPAPVAHRGGPEESDDEHEIGFLEAVDETVAYMGTVGDIATSLTAHFNELLTRIETRTQAINEANDRGDAQGYRVAINASALDMNIFCDNIAGELDGLRQAHEAAVNATLTTAEMARDFGPDNAEHIGVLLDSMQTLASSLESAVQGTRRFRQSVDEMPRVTTPITKARRKMLGVVDRLIAELEAARRLYMQAHATISQLEGNAGS